MDLLNAGLDTCFARDEIARKSVGHSVFVETRSRANIPAACCMARKLVAVDKPGLR